MEQLRIVRAFGNGITPSTEKGYRVESAHLTSELDALSLLSDLNARGDSAEFRLAHVYGNGTAVSNDAFRVETTHPVSERDALTIMRDLNTPYMGSRYLPNNRTSVFNGTSASNEDRQQQQG